MSITKKQELEYVKNRGLKCPYCESHQLDAHGPEVMTDQVIISVTCIDCKNEWNDVYKLAGILEE